MGIRILRVSFPGRGGFSLLASESYVAVDSSDARFGQHIQEIPGVYGHFGVRDMRALQNVNRTNLGGVDPLKFPITMYFPAD